MQQLLEFIPLVLFFLSYFSNETLTIGTHSLELGNIYSATIVLIASMFVALLVNFATTKTLEKRNLVTFLIVLVFGGLTLFLKNNLFIQWKPTIANWCFALVFILGPYFTNGEPIIKKFIGDKIHMPDDVWQRVTRFLIFTSIFLGLLNLYVVYNFSEPTWVKFKLWSALASSIVTSVVIIYMVAPHLSTDSQNDA
ncbi:MAG: inner membrane-spanning protein YciB [Pseudomonadota bacterium]